MARPVRKALLIIAIILIAMLLIWRLPGSGIHPLQLDYIHAFDDPATSSILVVAAFDAGSIAVIDSCEHQWRGGQLTIRMRSKVFVARDGRTTRIGAFRVPYPPAAPSTAPASGVVPASLEYRCGTEHATVDIAPLPAAFTPFAPVVDSTPR